MQRWRDKESILNVQLREISEEETRLLKEIQKVDQQLAYYDSLEKDMKKELEPPRMSSFLRSLKKA